jgi:hypothetical protein
MYKTYYICHHCANYITFNKSDIVKHYSNLSKCDSVNKYNYEDAYHLSLERKFYLNKDEINKEEFINLIVNYSDLDIIQKKKEIKELHKNNKINEIINKIYYLKDTNKYKCTDCLSEFRSKKSIEKHLLNKSKCNEIIKVNNEILKIKNNN